MEIKAKKQIRKQKKRVAQNRNENILISIALLILILPSCKKISEDQGLVVNGCDGKYMIYPRTGGWKISTVQNSSLLNISSITSKNGSCSLTIFNDGKEGLTTFLIIDEKNRKKISVSNTGDVEVEPIDR